MLDCAAIIVTYHPDPMDLKNIKVLSDEVQQVYVVDNTPNGGIAFPEMIKNIILKEYRNNIGLAAGLNVGVKLAIADGFKNMFIFDQDSRPSRAFLNNMLAFKTRIEKTFSDCAFVVPDFFDRNSRTYAKFPIIQRYAFSHASCIDDRAILLDHALIGITSGTLISKERFEEIGPFREDYFIDFIDNEYCLRAHKRGYRVVVNCKETLGHSIGKRSTENFCGLTIKPNRHPALRRFYIARNGIRTAIEYGGSYPSYCILIILRLLHEALSILLFEKRRKLKTEAMCLGVFYGLINKLGKIPIDLK